MPMATEPPTLVASAARGQSHIMLTHPVVPGSYVTVGAREPVWETHLTWMCTGTGPYTVWLGQMTRPTYLGGHHCVGTSVEVTGVGWDRIPGGL